MGVEKKKKNYIVLTFITSSLLEGDYILEKSLLNILKKYFQIYFKRVIFFAPFIRKGRRNTESLPVPVTINLFPKIRLEKKKNWRLLFKKIRKNK